MSARRKTETNGLLRVVGEEEEEGC